MAGPTIYWKYEGTTETAGTRTYANVSSGDGTDFSGNYTIWNTEDANCSNSSIYLEDVNGTMVADASIAVNWTENWGASESQADVTLSTQTIDFVSGTWTTGASGDYQVDFWEKIAIDGTEAVGTKTWKKVITYQYT